VVIRNGRLLSGTVQTARPADSDDEIPEAPAWYQNALTLARQEPERRFITRRLEELKRTREIAIKTVRLLCAAGVANVPAAMEISRLTV
jgi:hypothetical protein